MEALFYRYSDWDASGVITHLIFTEGIAGVEETKVGYSYGFTMEYTSNGEHDF